MRMFLRCAGFVLSLALLAPFTWADAAFRYHSEIQVTPVLSAAQLDKALGGNPDMLVRIKGNKAYSSQGHITTILDLTTQELTLLDGAHKRFAKVPASEYSQQMKTAIPGMPEQARAMLASLKTNVETRSTGRSEAIQGIQATEREVVMTLEMAMPGGAAAASVPFMKMIMQVWTADPSEAQRVPALQELQNYTSSATYAMNPTAMLQEIAASIPGFGDNLGKMMEAMSKNNGVALRIHMEIVSPLMALMSQQAPQGAAAAPLAGLGPDTPLMQMNQELAELSSDPLDDAIFQIPADFQAAPLSEIFKDAVSAPPPPPVFK